MSDDPQKPKPRRLSEISHLFLSSIRDVQTNGAARPQRTPPRSDVSIDLTPEEFARMYGGAQPAAEPQRKVVPVTAMISAHLNGKQFDRVKEYARHLAGRVGRVGLVELDGSELRIMCFEPGVPADDADLPPECVEPRQMTEALEEMNWDVERWLLLLPNPRTPEAKALLREIDHWLLLSTCDHDGVVSSYRMLKAVAETDRPRLSLALIGARDDADAGRVFQKLSSVCTQFLDWPVESEPQVQPAPGVSEHLVLLYRPTRDKAQLAIAPQWGVVGEFLAAGRAAELAQRQAAEAAAQLRESPVIASQEPRQLVADVVIPTEPRPEQASPTADAAPIQTPVQTPLQTPVPAGEPPRAAEQPAVILQMPAAFPAQAPRSADDTFDDVIDLPDHDASGRSILAAVLRNAAGGLIECPLRPPMCVEARLAVTRNRELVLLAVAHQGLSELRSIGQAYHWLAENRELIAMALPQFAVDARQPCRLRLLVDRADLSAGALAPLLQSDHVTIQAYRKLRWGERLGVSLEAA